MTTKKRSLQLPEVPTIAEAGLPGFEVNNCYGILAPARTPKAIVSAINSAIVRVLRVPVVVVVVLGMSYRYIFLLIDSARDMLESRRSRMVGRLPGPDRRRLAAASVGVLMSKTMQLSGDVYSAMLSRGFSGEVYLLDDFRAAALDWLMLLVFAVLAVSAFYFGR